MSDNLKECLDQFHDKGVFLPTKTIMLTGEVDEEMYASAMASIHALDSLPGEITIKLMSEGGDVTVARGIYDAIANAKNIVRIQTYGVVASAATIILQAADKRVMAPNSLLMVHAGSEGMASDHPRNVDSLYKQYRADEKWMQKIYLDRIKEKKKRYTKQKLEDLLVWDRYLTAKEAVELGLADEIGEIS